MIYIASMYGSLVGSQLLLQFREFVVKVNILDTGFHTHHSYCMQGVCSFILGNACRSKSWVVLDFHVHLKLSRFGLSRALAWNFKEEVCYTFLFKLGFTIVSHQWAYVPSWNLSKKSPLFFVFICVKHFFWLVLRLSPVSFQALLAGPICWNFLKHFFKKSYFGIFCHTCYTVPSPSVYTCWGGGLHILSGKWALTFFLKLNSFLLFPFYAERGCG